MEHRTRFSRRISARVKKAIDESGMSQALIAQRAGFTPPTLHRRLRGVNPFDLDELAHVARALDRDPFEFFSFEVPESAAYSEVET